MSAPMLAAWHEVLASGDPAALRAAFTEAAASADAVRPAMTMPVISGPNSRVTPMPRPTTIALSAPKRCASAAPRITSSSPTR